jgi:HAD superfamily hydrolase (TIGR01450 family)
VKGTGRPLAETFDVALLDLDGVVYRGRQPVEHAAQALERARAAGMRLAFVTNNALRPPSEVADRIRAAGVPVLPQEIATSAQAAARLLAEQLPAGSRVLVAGGAGLRQAVQERGLVAVDRADAGPAGVVCGYDPELTYARLAEAVVAILAGALWVASNTDATVPTERGLLPGAGAIVAFIATATKVRPQVAGKPERALHEESMSRSGAQHPVVVGDRLDTDIEGANGVGAPSLLVLTGVSTLADLIEAPPALRPTYLGRDLLALLAPAPDVTLMEGAARCGRWTASIASGALSWSQESGGERLGEDGLDAFRAGVALTWSRRDAGKPPVRVGDVVPEGCEAFRETFQQAQASS